MAIENSSMNTGEALTEIERKQLALNIVQSNRFKELSGQYARVWKRVIDIVIASLLLIVLLIPLVVISIVIRIDSPGNPLFLQKRVGRNDELFTMWKFRTMTARPADEFALLKDEDGVFRHKVRNDPRVTRVGKILRKTSLDEVPQLVNVIVGQMSLVGPRPELPQIVANYELWQQERHLVRPGITGWWQIAGRSDLPMHEHTELDIYYVENISFQLDLDIVKKTIFGVIRGVGAF